MAVGAVGGPAHRDASAVAHEGPLPTAFAPVSGVAAGAFAAAGGFVLGPVDRYVGEVQTHDAVIGRDGLCAQRVEYAGFGPFVAARPQGRVRDPTAQQALRGDPRTTRHQAGHDPHETHPVRDPGIVTAQRMGISVRRQQRLHRGPHRINHFRLKSAHNMIASISCRR